MQQSELEHIEGRIEKHKIKLSAIEEEMKTDCDKIEEISADVNSWKSGSAKIHERINSLKVSND